MATSTVEDYIKHVYLKEQALPEGALVPMGELAVALKVVPGTATTMVKTLAAAGLVLYEPRSGVRLSESGKKLALHVLRRHRLVELFLVQMLGMDWSEIHDEAEQLEHVISDRLLERIDSVLGHPTVDPHGDPIPDAKGDIKEQKLVSLIEVEEGTSVIVGRISDQDGDFLQFAEQSGLTPGKSVVLSGRDPQSETLSLRTEGGPLITIALAAAEKIKVKRTFRVRVIKPNE
ncbi:MAG: metal-dependent transcriptional regulator [Opitutaceae bacterium]|nr:metal-dependent transcriptional regulator [Opitutaceae bacterium]